MSKNNQQLLEGDVDVIDAGDDGSEAERLRGELQRVSRERDTLRAENIRLRQRVNQIDGPAAALRQTLDPLYTALRAIMGEIEVIDPRADVAASAAPVAGTAPDGRIAAVWQAWKEKFGMGSATSRVIDALLTHGELNTPQLKVAGRMAGRTVGDAIYKLNSLGLINKNGGKFSLKQL